MSKEPINLAKVLVSACLAGCPCRYDGGSSLADLPQDVELVLYCPEVEGGLPTPREPAEIVGGTGTDVLAGDARVVTRSGQDVTAQYIRGAKGALDVCRQQSISRAMLKKRSPSCGGSQIYNGTYSGQLREGAGVTAALLKQHGVVVEEM